jgi:hypothetical protein
MCAWHARHRRATAASSASQTTSRARRTHTLVRVHACACGRMRARVRRVWCSRSQAHVACTPARAAHAPSATSQHKHKELAGALHCCWNTLRAHTPGGKYFDPIGFSRGDAAMYKKYKQNEITNGRLAMVANLGFWAQYAATGKGPIENLQVRRPRGRRGVWWRVVGRGCGVAVACGVCADVLCAPHAARRTPTVCRLLLSPLLALTSTHRHARHTRTHTHIHAGPPGGPLPRHLCHQRRERALPEQLSSSWRCRACGTAVVWGPVRGVRGWRSRAGCRISSAERGAAVVAQAGCSRGRVVVLRWRSDGGGGGGGGARERVSRRRRFCVWCAQQWLCSVLRAARGLLFVTPS